MNELLRRALLDRACIERDEALRELGKVTFWLAAIILSSGGEVRVPDTAIQSLSRDAEIERYDDPVTHEAVFRIAA